LNLLTETVVPCVINNQVVHSQATYDLRDPHTSEVLYKVSAASPEIAAQAVKAAEDALPAWKATPATERRKIFIKAAELLKTRSAELAVLEAKETTSAPGWSGFDVGLAADVLEELAAASTALRGEIAPSPPGQRAYILREPFGVVFAIAPWNAPYTLGFRAVANPIMAGNTCVLKTSEFSPKVHTVIAQIFIEAGLPAGVLNIIHVDPKDAPKLVEQVIVHRAIGKVNFTGSTRVGAIIAETCGRNLKPVTLELGGAAPFIVLADADLEYAANAALFGGFFHSGQICMSTNSVIVHESVASEFTSHLNAHLPQLNAAADSNVLRGLFTTSSAQRVNGLVEDAIGKGAKVAAGNHGVDKNVVQPIVLEGVTSDMRIYSEEIFGPVFNVIQFKDEQEAVRIANSTEYGLAAAIYSKDTSRAYSLATQIHAGMVHVNGATVHDNQTMPHGGFKKSGWGRFNGLDGLKEFSQSKVITINELHKFPI